MFVGDWRWYTDDPDSLRRATRELAQSMDQALREYVPIKPPEWIYHTPASENENPYFPCRPSPEHTHTVGWKFQAAKRGKKKSSPWADPDQPPQSPPTSERVLANRALEEIEEHIDMYRGIYNQGHSPFGTALRRVNALKYAAMVMRDYISKLKAPGEGGDCKSPSRGMYEG